MTSEALPLELPLETLEAARQQVAMTGQMCWAFTEDAACRDSCECRDMARAALSAGLTQGGITVVHPKVVVTCERCRGTGFDPEPVVCKPGCCGTGMEQRYSRYCTACGGSGDHDA